MRRSAGAGAAVALMGAVAASTACSGKDAAPRPPLAPDTARVSLRHAAAGFEVRLEHGSQQAARWHVDALDGRLGEQIAARLAAGSERPAATGVILCGDPQVPLARLHDVGSGLRGYQIVACLPDRRNCPGTCPD